MTRFGIGNLKLRLFWVQGFIEGYLNLVDNFIVRVLVVLVVLDAQKSGLSVEKLLQLLDSFLHVRDEQEHPLGLHLLDHLELAAGAPRLGNQEVVIYEAKLYIILLSQFMGRSRFVFHRKCLLKFLHHD